MTNKKWLFYALFQFQSNCLRHGNSNNCYVKLVTLCCLAQLMVTSQMSLLSFYTETPINKEGGAHNVTWQPPLPSIVNILWHGWNFVSMTAMTSKLSLQVWKWHSVKFLKMDVPPWINSLVAKLFFIQTTNMHECVVNTVVVHNTIIIRRLKVFSWPQWIIYELSLS